MRRLVVPEDPFARSAIWSRNLAIFALLVAVVGVLLSRKGLDPSAALAIETGALTIAAFSAFFAVVAMAVIWRTGFRGIGLALGGLALAAALFAYPTYIVVEARTAVPLLDVSTNTADPPTFMTSDPALAARHGFTPAKTMSRADIALQKRLYPDLETLSLDGEAMDVDAAIHKLIKRRKWQIVDEIRPIRFATGHIDLVIKSALMGFPTDMTIRLRGLGNRTLVDIRSVTRTSWQERPDANAERVRQLADDIEDAVGDS